MASQKRTPENTPVPGGGRWKWNDTKGQWDTAPDPTNEPTTQQPTDTNPTE